VADYEVLKWTVVLPTSQLGYTHEKLHHADFIYIYILFAEVKSEAYLLLHHADSP